MASSFVAYGSNGIKVLSPTGTEPSATIDANFKAVDSALDGKFKKGSDGGLSITSPSSPYTAVTSTVTHVGQAASGGGTKSGYSLDISCPSVQATVGQTGDYYGGSAVKFQNRNGLNGALFCTTSDPYGINLIDFGLKTHAGYENNIRYSGSSNQIQLIDVNSPYSPGEPNNYAIFGTAGIVLTPQTVISQDRYNTDPGPSAVLTLTGNNDDIAGVVLTPSGAPATPSAGHIYFSSVDNHFWGYNGTTWKQLDN